MTSALVEGGGVYSTGRRFGIFVRGEMGTDYACICACMYVCLDARSNVCIHFGMNVRM